MLKENLKYVRTAEEGHHYKPYSHKAESEAIVLQSVCPSRNDNLYWMNDFCEMITKMDKWRPKYSVYIKEIEFEINLATKKIPVLCLQFPFPLKICSADLSLSFPSLTQSKDLPHSRVLGSFMGPAGTYNFLLFLLTITFLYPEPHCTRVFSGSTQYPHQGALEDVWEYELSLEVKKCHWHLVVRAPVSHPSMPGTGPTVKNVGMASRAMKTSHNWTLSQFQL